ncbi:FAD-dependent oxidoreductase [Fructobacillus cardui]|uniref:FAD-dependent oxidoreductase n=1 Tax=Fructobacillus cardui TaxID=2893170 RepID=UPI00200A27FA|nr:FAD-dependent oxidoreductase [Fructobacillus cardui]MCK8626745.1 FAD-dependent oxidoreductase [Fructobacillus cardui]
MAAIYDFAIIGTGLVGLAAGYYASQKGLKVLELDVAVLPHTQDSHHSQTRLIRHAYGEGEKYLPMLLRAQKLWDELQQKTHRDIFHQTSLLN